MSVNNMPKFLGIMFICVLVAVLLALGEMDPVAGAGLIGTAMGYLAGNGVAARTGDDIVPIFKDTHPHHPHEDRSPVEDEA